MLTMPAQTIEVLLGNTRSEHVRVFINGEDIATYPGFDALTSVTVSASVDDPHMTCDITLKREQFDFSVAGLATDAMANNPGGVYSALVDLNREVFVQIAVVPMGQTPASGDWTAIFWGYIDEIDDASGDSVSISCRDLGAPLADTQIEVDRAYGYGTDAGCRIWEPGQTYTVGERLIPTTGKLNGKYFSCSTAGTSGATEPTWPTSSTVADGSVVWTTQGNTSTTGQAAETIMQQILSDNGQGGLVFNTPVSPLWIIRPYTQQREKVLEALLTISNGIGWDLRMRFDELNWKGPDRTKTVADATFTPSQYESISSLKREIMTIRNKVAVIYSDSSDLLSDGKTAKRKRVLATDSSSITKYGTRYMEIAEDATSQIDTSTEANLLANNCLSDLKEPGVTQEVNAYFTPFVELGDLYTFGGNDRHYSADQKLAVVAYRHSLSGSGDGGYTCRTSMTCRGAPASGHRRWLAMSAQRPGTGYNEAHRLVDLTSTAATVLAANPIVGGAQLEKSFTPAKTSADKGAEWHVSGTPGFTPSSSTLVADGDMTTVELANLTPGATYYAVVVPKAKNSERPITGQPTAEVSFVAGRAGAGHLTSTVDYYRIPLNGGFETHTDLAAPPDHWAIDPGFGTWGVTISAQTGSGGINGVRWLRFHNNSGIIRSAMFGVTSGDSYIPSFWFKPVSGTGNALFYVRWYSDDFVSNVIDDFANPLDVTTGVGVWRQEVGRRLTAPSWARYAQFTLDSGLVGTPVFDADTAVLTVGQTQEPQIAPTLAGTWANLGGAWDTVAYMKDSLGFVHVKGAATGGTGGTVIFTLPAGYRPALAQQGAAYGNGGVATVWTVDAAGQVFCGTTNGFQFLNGITFKAA